MKNTAAEKHGRTDHGPRPWILWLFVVRLTVIPHPHRTRCADAAPEAVGHCLRRDLRSILGGGYHLLDRVVLPPVVVVPVMGCACVRGKKRVGRVATSDGCLIIERIQTKAIMSHGQH